MARSRYQHCRGKHLNYSLRPIANMAVGSYISGIYFHRGSVALWVGLRHFHHADIKPRVDGRSRRFLTIAPTHISDVLDLRSFERENPLEK